MRKLLALTPCCVPLAFCCLWAARPTGFAGDHQVHYLASEELAASWRQGVLWPGALDNVNNGLGSLWPSYYPPLFTGLCAFGLLFNLGYWQIAGIAIGCGHLLGCLFCFFWLRTHLPNRSARWGTFFYGVSPYFVFNVFSRGAFPEALAWEWLPGILWATDALRKEWRWWPAFGGASLFGLLALTNFPALVLSAGGVLAYTFVASGAGKRLPAFVRTASVPLGGLALTAFFWVPAWTQRDSVVTPWAGQPTEASFWSFAHLPRNYVSEALLDSCVSRLLVVWELVGLWALWRSRRFFWGNFISTWILMALGLALSLDWFAWLYSVIPFLDHVQFPWRALGLTGVGVAFLLGYCAYALRRSRWVLWVVAAVWLGLVSDQILSAPRIDLNVVVQNPARILFDYVPVSSYGLIPEEPLPLVEVAQGEVNVTVVDWVPGARTIHTDAAVPFELLVRTYAHPRWLAMDQSGHELLVSREKKWGRVSVRAPAETKVIQLRLATGVSGWVGRGATCFTLAMFLVGAGRGMLRARRGPALG